jgi:hypothetical protein
MAPPFRPGTPARTPNKRPVSVTKPSPKRRKISGEDDRGARTKSPGSGATRKPPGSGARTKSPGRGALSGLGKSYNSKSPGKSPTPSLKMKGDAGADMKGVAANNKSPADRKARKVQAFSTSLFEEEPHCSPEA